MCIRDRLYVSSTCVSCWRKTKLLHITYRRSVNSMTSERRIWTSIVFTNFYRWSRASNVIDVIVSDLCSFVCFCVIQGWVAEVKICFVLYSISKVKVSLYIIIEKVIKDICSTLMYVCVKRNTQYLFESLWLANILHFAFYWPNHVFVSDSRCIATFIEGDYCGNVGACPCTGQCSVALLLCIS